MTEPRPTEAIDPRVRERLLDLAEEASFYLRRHREPSVRIAAALLLASSLAGCSRPPASAPPIAPLAQEVRDGLPTAPGRYPVDPSTLTRDQQGVYSMGWRTAAGPANNWTPARSSLMQVAQGTDDVLDVPASGDPTLYLRPNTPISLIDPDARNAAGVGSTPTPGRSGSTTSSSTGRGSVAWYPFPLSTASSSAPTGSDVPATTPAYRNPPAPTQADIAQGSVRGSSSSLNAPSTGARTWSTTGRGTSGQDGGSGTGSAVAGRSGAADGIASGAARPSSSGFSGGGGGHGASSAGG